MTDIKIEILWREGSRHVIPADDANQELTRIAQKHGVASPATIVNESRRKNACLYPEFEWDDGIAAEKWRIQQARTIANDLVLVYIEPDGDRASTAPAQVSVVLPISDSAGSDPVLERGYIPTVVALDEKEMREQILQEARTGLNSWRRRYRHLDELTEVILAIDKELRK